MKKNLGPETLIYPMPVLMIASYNDDNTIDCMTAAWGGVADTNKISICLDSSHKTTKNILQNKDFTVSFAVEEYVKECDYLGIVSYNQDKDKFSKTGLHASKSSIINAPVIEEFPLTIECRLNKVVEEEGLIIADILNVIVDSEILTEGKIDLSKFKVLTFDQANRTYHVIGKKVADAFKVGLEIKNR